MSVTKAPLSLSEKKKLYNTFKFRLVLLVGIIPVLFASASFFIQSITDYSVNQYAAGTFIFCTCFFILCLYLFFKLAVPYYKQTLRNIRAKDKLIIETVVTDIKSEWVDEFGLTFVIQTEYPVPIVSTINRLLNPEFGYKDLRPNMRIRIHTMEENLMDILYIEPA